MFRERKIQFEFWAVFKANFSKVPIIGPETK